MASGDCFVRLDELDTLVLLVLLVLLDHLALLAKKRELSLRTLFVIQLGLEPRTPSLKGMCSTC